MYARLFFLAAVGLIAAAAGLHVAATRHQRQVGPLIGRAMGVPDPERTLLDIEARQHARQGAALGYLGLGSAGLGLVAAVAAMRRREPAPHWVTLGLLVLYIAWQFAWS